MHSVGFIGLGNVGGKLAGSLLRNKCGVMVRDLDRDVAAPFLEAGAKWADSPKAMAEACEIIITCLPLPWQRHFILGYCGSKRDASKHWKMPIKRRVKQHESEVSDVHYEQ